MVKAIVEEMPTTEQELVLAYEQAHTGAITANQFEAIWNDKDDGGADNGKKVNEDAQL